MGINFSDAGLSGLSSLGILLWLPFAIILGEAAIMRWLRLNASFGKCCLHSLLVNIASYIMGYLVSTLKVDLSFESGNIGGTLIAFLLSVVVEAGLLQLLNRNKAMKKIWLVSLVMNTVSYALVLIIFNVF